MLAVDLPTTGHSKQLASSGPRCQHQKPVGIFPMKNDQTLGVCIQAIFRYQPQIPHQVGYIYDSYMYMYMYIYVYIYILYIYIYYIHVYPIIYPHECLMKSKCLSFKQHFQVQPDIRPVISNARQLFPALEYWVGRGLVHLFIGLQMEGTNSEGMDDAWWLRHGGCVPQIPGWEENTVW